MKISFDELDEAFLFSGDEASYWLDKATGRVLLIGSETKQFLEDEGYFEDDEREAVRRILTLLGEIESDEETSEADEARYLEITPPGSDESWKVMRDFVLNVKDERLQAKLENALHGGKPFRKFKDILSDYPQEREQWFQYEAERRREQISEWAQSENIEVDFS